MTPQDIIRAAIPGADEDLCEHVIWGRTAFPCGPLTARILYQAAHRFKRACDAGKQLCELCDRLVTDGGYTCEQCNTNLERIRNERDK